MDVQCGGGEQPIKWLAAVALARYDSNYGAHLGIVMMLDLLFRRPKFSCATKNSSKVGFNLFDTNKYAYAILNHSRTD